MALRPGSRLLISSHFMPLPRRSMIKASSSADHFDCFFAGDSEVWAGNGRFVGTEFVELEVVEAAVPGVCAGTDTDREEI